MSRTGEALTLDRLGQTATEDWDAMRLFGSAEKLVEVYFADQERLGSAKAMNPEPKGYDGHMDPAIAVKLQRTRAAVVFIMQDKIPGDENCTCGCRRAEHCGGKHLNEELRWILKQVYHVGRSYEFVSDEMHCDSRTLGRLIDYALRIIRERMDHRGLLRKLATGEGG